MKVFPDREYVKENVTKSLGAIPEIVPKLFELWQPCGM